MSKLKAGLERRPQAVLFDWDNTIVDTHHIIFEALNKTLLDLGRQPVKKYLNNSARIEHFKNLFGKDWEKACLILKFHLKTESSEKLTIFPDVIETLEYLKKYQIFTAIVSNKFGELLRSEVKCLKLEKYFDVIVGSGDTDSDKPSSKPLLYSLKDTKIQINEHNVFFIGDGLADMQCAYEAGVTGIIYRSTDIIGFDNIIIKNYKELINILEVKAK